MLKHVYLRIHCKNGEDSTSVWNEELTLVTIEVEMIPFLA